MSSARGRARPSRRSRPWRWLKVVSLLFLRRLDWTCPSWLGGLTPWGTSVALHILALFVLAIVVWTESHRAYRVEVETELGPGMVVDDVTSLVTADRAGDPFTSNQIDEPPSLALHPDRDATVSNTPMLSEHTRFAPVLNLTAGRPPVSLIGTGPPVNLARRVALTTPFAGRRPEERAKMVQREGGTVQSERAVEQGLDWLARHQSPDGRWSLDPSENCQGDGCPPVPAMISDSAATGLALLPFLGAGHDHIQEGRYKKQIAAGLAWLRNHQGPDGNLYADTTGDGPGTVSLYSHAIAAMALCEAYGLTRDASLREAAQKSIQYIGVTQSPDNGGWRYEPGMAGDTSVTGWQMLAFRSAQLSGLEIPDATLKAAIGYLNRAAVDSKGATYSYMPGGSATPVMTAEALLIRQYLGWSRNHTSIKSGAALIARNLVVTDRNIYYWYYATPMLHNIRTKEWTTWNAKVREYLIKTQVVSKGCDRGSWDPQSPIPDRWGRRAGRLFQTSLSLLTLEVYYRYLPLYQPTEKDPAEPNAPPLFR